MKIFKKRVKKYQSKNHYTKSLLRSAFSDLDKELVKLRIKRDKYREQLKKLNKSTENTKVEENSLQDKLNTLRSKEIELNNTKQDLLAHLSEMDIKLDKIKKAKDELSDI